LPHIAWELPYKVRSCRKGSRMELTERRGTRRTQIMNEIKETTVPVPERGNSRSPSLENSLWKSFGPVVIRTAEDINEWI